jgi:hypothetical protein
VATRCRAQSACRSPSASSTFCTRACARHHGATAHGAVHTGSDARRRKTTRGDFIARQAPVGPAAVSVSTEHGAARPPCRPHTRAHTRQARRRRRRALVVRSSLDVAGRGRLHTPAQPRAALSTSARRRTVPRPCTYLFTR